MKDIILFNNKFFIFPALFLFSLLINQYYGNIGVFPVDSFSHFDTGYRILLNEHPFKDYWIVSGPFVDYFQALFFYLFGVNWQIYILHASIINAILTITTYIVLDFLSLIGYALLAQKLITWIKTNPKTINTISASVLVIIAIIIIVTQQY